MSKTIYLPLTKATRFMEGEVPTSHGNPERLAWGKSEPIFSGAKIRSLARFDTQNDMRNVAIPWDDMESIIGIWAVIWSSDGSGVHAYVRGGAPRVLLRRLTEDWAVAGVNAATFANQPTTTGTDEVNADLAAHASLTSAKARVGVTALAMAWFPTSVGGAGLANYGWRLWSPNEATTGGNADAWGPAYGNADKQMVLEVEYQERRAPLAPANLVVRAYRGSGTTDSPLDSEPAGVIHVDADLSSDVKDDYITGYRLRVIRDSDGVEISDYSVVNIGGPSTVDLNITGNGPYYPLGVGQPGGPRQQPWAPNVSPGYGYRLGLRFMNKYGRWGPENDPTTRVLRTNSRPLRPLDPRVEFPPASIRRPIFRFRHNDPDPQSVMHAARVKLWRPDPAGWVLVEEIGETYPSGGGEIAELQGSKDLEWGNLYAWEPKTWDTAGFLVAASKYVRDHDEGLEGATEVHYFISAGEPPPDPTYDLSAPNSCTPRDGGKVWTLTPNLVVADSARSFIKYEIEVYGMDQVSGDDPKPGATYLTHIGPTTQASATTSGNVAVGSGVLAVGQLAGWRGRAWLTTADQWSEWTRILPLTVNALPRGPKIISPAFGAIVAGSTVVVEAHSDDPDAPTHGDLIIAREWDVDRRTAVGPPETWTDVTAPTDTMGNTTLAAASAVGDMLVKYTASTNFAVGDIVAIDAPANREYREVAAAGVGTTGAGGTGLTFTEALGLAHASGVALVEVMPTLRSFTGLSTAGLYSFKARDKDQNTAGTFGDWSNGNVRYLVTIQTPPVAAVGTAVDDEDPGPALDWAVTTGTQVRYVVRIYEKSGTQYLLVHEDSATTATTTHDLEPGVLRHATTYRFVVTVYDADGLSGSYTSPDWTTDFPTPAAMTGLVLTLYPEETRVHLAWSTPPAGTAWVSAERAVGQGEFVEVATVDPATLYYDDWTANTRRDLTYRVKASNGALEGPFDEETTLIVPPPTPPGEWHLLKPGDPGQYVKFRAEPGAGRSDPQRVAGHEAAGREYPIAVEDVPGGPTFSFVGFFLGEELEKLEKMRRMIRADYGGPGLCLKTGNGYAYSAVKFTSVEETGERAGIRHVSFSGFQVG